MCSKTNILPSTLLDGVKFNALIKTELLLKNGKKTVMLTAVPEDFSFDDAMAGVKAGARLSGRVARIRQDVFSLCNGEIKQFGRGISSDLEK